MRRLDRDTSMLPVVGAIAVATTIAYASSFAGGWISDDVEMIAENTLLRSLGPANLGALASTRTDGVNYIPLTFFSLALDYQLWGLQPFGFHVTNLALHIANAILVYLLLVRLRESHGLAAVASLLWALHPVQVESVAWISERKNLLSTLFFLLALLAYLRWSAAPRARTYALALLLFLGALLSKVNTIVLPAIILAYEIIVQRRLRRRDAAAAFGMLLCGAAVAWANLQGNPSHGAAYHGGSLAVTLRTSATVIPMYLVNAVAPLSLSTYYAVPLRASWLHPTVAVAVVLIVVLTGLVLWGARRGRADGFWLAWFGITLSPMLNLVPFPALMADRYLYIPLLGLLVPVLHLTEALLRRFGALRAAPALVAVTVAGLGTLTMLRVPVFHDELSLWTDFALKMPYITSDEPYGPRPRPNEIRILSDAVARHPESAILHNNLGGIAFEENRLADAVAFLVRAHELDPKDPAIALNLGRAYLRTGRIDDAERALQAAAALEPPSFYAQLNLARVYFLRRDLARARATLDHAKTLRPQSPAWRVFEQRLDQAARGPA